MDLEMKLTPHHLRGDIYGTGTRDGCILKMYNTNMDLEIDLEMDLSPPQNQLRLDAGGTRDGARHAVDPHSLKVRHIWDLNQRWSVSSKVTIQIWVKRGIWRWSWPPNWLHFGTHRVKKTIDGTTCKNFINSVSTTHISGIHVKMLREWTLQQKIEMTTNSE